MEGRLFIYNEQLPAGETDISFLCARVREKCPWLEITVRPGFFNYFQHSSTAAKLAACWVEDLLDREGRRKNAQERQICEERYLNKPEPFNWPVVYEGWRFWEIMRELLPPEESGAGGVHLVLTQRLLATREAGERRYHARTILAAQPAVISGSGLVEAPARPAEYYFWEAGYRMLGHEIPLEVVRENFFGRFIFPGDTRLPEVMVGYILQAVAYHFYGEGFCSDPRCRLFNAHYQKDMLRAQLESPEFCPRHRRMFSAASAPSHVQYD